ncbi:hypothetical protein [Nocardia sp. NPDC056100]|uniref:hypothetical protein n=1 Tax=Nocardia sp. NPDC056100 TaxID=3345712 RepID=UPI0035D66F2E
MSAVGNAQIIHALSRLDDDGHVIGDEWPRLAQEMVRLDLNWPAICDLARLNDPAESEVSAKVAELSTQLEAHPGVHPRLDPWDVVVGLYGRAWRMDLIDHLDAMYRMEMVRGLCYFELDASDSAAIYLFWRAGQVTEQDDYTLPTETVDFLCREVLEAADQLLPPGAVDYPLCQAIRKAMHANGC